MGARLSIMAPSAPTVAVSSYIDVLDQYQFIEVINNCRFLKAIKALDRRNGRVVFIKLFIKPSLDIALGSTLSAVAADCRVLLPLPDTLPWNRLIETDHAAYLIRQLSTTNLYDRLSLRPFLQPLEKDFMVFQILMLISRVHKCRVRHGDIKLENFLVTSWNWLSLSDFATHIKPVHLPEDNPSEFSFYFDTSNRRACYVAPERFHSAKLLAKISKSSSLTDAMDLFSTGCAIAELYADGEPAFTLSQLFQYMRGEYTITSAGLENPHMKQLVASLVNKDPSSRPLASQLLRKYRGSCFPDVFYTFLYDYMAKFNDTSFFCPQANDFQSLSDVKIRYIYNTFGVLIQGLGIIYGTDDSLFGSNLIPLRLDVPGVPRNCTMSCANESPITGGACLIILNVVLSLVKTLTQVESKIMACNLIMALSASIDDEHRLDRALPYLCALIDEYCELLAARLLSNEPNHDHASPKVVCFALKSITTLLMSCLTITPLNVLVFPKYIIPKLITLLTVVAPEAEKTMVEVAIAACISSLACTASRFWTLSLSFSTNGLTLAQVLAQALPESGIADVASSHTALGVPRDHIVSEFESIALTLLTSTNYAVKMSILQDVGGLCQFLGVEKASNVILPHLITYLNDPHYQVRLAFLDSVLQVGPFVGVLAFEQYILPLLMQTLQDSEQLVVVKVLQVFYTFVQSRLINPRSQFNALGVYQELLQNSVLLLLHPNEWIRQSVLHLFIAISNEVRDADRYCFVFPILERYLAFDVDRISWNDVYPALTKPLSQRVYECASLWSLRASSKSLFWRNQQNRRPSRLIHTSKKRIVSFSKEMGKSVYLPRLAAGENNRDASVSVPISSEDKQWLEQLKSIGFGGQEAWKLLVLRSYIYQISRSGGASKSGNESLEQIVLSSDCLQSIQIRSAYRTESSPAEEQFLQDADFSTLIQVRDTRPASQSLLLPGLFAARALVQTIEANVFGELDVSHDSHALHKAGGTTTRRRVVCTAGNKAVVATITYDYSKQDPYISNFLETIDLKPSISDFAEFGPHIDSPFANNNIKTIKGKLVARIRAGKLDKDSIDGISCLAVCKVLPFFVTGLESGLVEVWDASSSEIIMAAKRPSLVWAMNARVTSVHFLPNRLAFVASSSDGEIRCMRVELSQSFDKCLLNFTKLQTVRNIELKKDLDGFVVASAFNATGPNHKLFCATSRGKLIEFDIGCGKINSSLQNPLHHGNITTMLVDPKGLWVLVGTDNGIFDLWDMRFKVLTSSWQLKIVSTDTNLLIDVGEIRTQSLANDRFVMTAGSTSDVIVWEVPTFKCVDVLSPKSQSIGSKKYLFEKIPDRGDNFDISAWVASFAKLSQTLHDDISKSASSECTALAIGSSARPFDLVLCATADRIIHQWDCSDDKKFAEGNVIGARVQTQAKQSETMRNAISYNLKSTTAPLDTVRAMGYLPKREPLVVSVDRSGYIHVYL